MVTLDNEDLFKKAGYKKIIHKKVYVDSYFGIEAKKLPTRVKKSHRRDFILPEKNIKQSYDFDDELLKTTLSSRQKQNYEIILNDKSKLDKKLILSFEKNTIIYDDKIDLHGLKIQEAFEIFIKFIKHNFLLNRRLLLIITGFGSSSNSDDTINSNLIKWINGNNDLKKIVL